MSELIQGSWDPDALGPLDPKIIGMANRHWESLAGGFNKNCLYGAGPLASTLSSVDHLDTMAPSSSRPPRPSPENEQLRQEVGAHGQQLKHLMTMLEQVMTQQGEILKYYKSEKAKKQKTSKSDEELVYSSDDGPY